jgi:enolase
LPSTAIERVTGRRLWDSRGRPTVEVEVTLTSGATGRALAPAGASRGTAEAIDRRDGGSRFNGQDVTLAVAAVNTEMSARLQGMDANSQAEIDAALIALDGTPNKSRLGGNATVAASMAVAHVAANAAGLPLWRYLAGEKQVYLPLPEIQIFGGGAHAGRRVDVQDFMIVAIGASDYTQALDWSAEVYRRAGEWMSHRDSGPGVIGKCPLSKIEVDSIPGGGCWFEIDQPGYVSVYSKQFLMAFGAHM